MQINRLQRDSFGKALWSSETGRDVLLVQGARQVGKTTLIEQCLADRPGVFRVNLERDLDALRSIDRTNSFDEFTKLLLAHFKVANIDQPGAVLFIDEAQESEKIGGYLRFMKEEWQHIRVVLTGSSMSRIFRSADRVPVGRYRPWLVTPLVFSEFLSASEHNHLKDLLADFSSRPREGLIDGALHTAFLNVLDEYLLVGGLPEVVTTFFAGGDYRSKRRSIYDAQEDDFVRKSSLSDRSLFASGLKGVADFIGSPAKFSHIHESKKVAEKVLSEQIAWNLILEIEQRSMSSTTRHLPKRYLYDIGMAQDLRDMPFPRLSLVSTKNPDLRGQLGGLFENALLLQILEEQTYLGNLSGWRQGGSDGPEVDFVYRTTTSTLPIECKASQSLSKKHWSGVEKYLEVTEQRIGFLVTAAPFQVFRRNDRVLVNLPLYLASLETIGRCTEQFGGK